MLFFIVSPILFHRVVALSQKTCKGTDKRLILRQVATSHRIKYAVCHLMPIGVYLAALRLSNTIELLCYLYITITKATLTEFSALNTHGLRHLYFLTANPNFLRYSYFLCIFCILRHSSASICLRQSLSLLFHNSSLHAFLCHCIHHVIHLLLSHLDDNLNALRLLLYLELYLKRHSP